MSTEGAALSSTLQAPPAAVAEPGPFPVANSTMSFWRAEPNEMENYRSPGPLPATCDVLIIGAGYSGAATAYHMLDGNASPPSMVILEARAASSGATGRNGGHVKPDVYYKTLQYMEMYGRAAAAEIAQFEAKQVYAVKALVEKEQIDCDFHLTRAYDVFLEPALAAHVKAAYDQLLADGFPTMPDIGYLPAARAKALSGVKGAQGAFSFTVASLWPYKMVTHLLRLAVQRGVNLQTNTPVTHVSATRDAAGYYTVDTDRGPLRAHKIVFATNGYTAGLLPQFRDKIIPVRGICSHIAVPAGQQAPSTPYSYSVRHSKKGADYQITRPDGSIIVGGGRPSYLAQGDQWYNVCDDSQLIEPAVPYFDGLMQRTFRDWEHSGASVSRIWTGIMGYTNDLMPHIGTVPGKEGQFICAGFNGHGMPAILLSAKGISKMVLEDAPFEAIGVPSPYESTQKRLNSDVNKVLDLLK